jgi:16S rRNA pseudouridine516 synthase
MGKPMRLDKYLCASGFGTRMEMKKLLKQGIVTVDGEIVRDQGMQIKPGEHTVVCNGEEVRYKEHVYIMLNKPDGVISATGDRWHDTVLDLLEGAYAEHPLFPVGRLDRDTTGLLLLTDDGPLAHELLAPKKHVAKIYVAELTAPVDDSDIAAFAEGIVLEDFTTKPAALAKLDGNSAEVTLTEGKFHQVKRMFEARGKTVLKLHRRAMGPLALDSDMAPGDWRELTSEEEALLKKKEQ